MLSTVILKMNRKENLRKISIPDFDNFFIKYHVTNPHAEWTIVWWYSIKA